MRLISSEKPRALIIVALFISGAVFRFQGLFNDFWLDEIWSLNIAENLTSSLEALKVHLDNNHLLNTVYMYLLGNSSDWTVYRLPALLAGVGTILMIGYLVLRRDRRVPQGIFLFFLFAFSYPLILYSSEARGYAPMIFFLLASWFSLESYLETKRFLSALAFWICSVLGVLSHLSFINFYAAAFIWSVVWWYRSLGVSAVKKGLLRLHLVPLLFQLFLYFTHIRYLQQGGGPQRSYMDVVVETLSVSFGGPDLLSNFEANGLTVISIGFGVVIIYCLELYLLWRDGSDKWLFYLLVVCLSPAMFLLIGAPRVIFVRYFLVSVVFLYFVSASFLSRLWTTGRFGGFICIGVLGAYFYGHSIYTLEFLREGRGHYLAALQYIVNETHGPIATMAGDHDFRNRTVMDYYNRFLTPGKLRYLEQDAEANADWFLRQSQDRFSRPETTIVVRGGIKYDLKMTYRSGALSGWNWYLYSKSDGGRDRG